MNTRKSYTVDNALNFVFDGNQSELSDFSSEEDNIDEIEDAVCNEIPANDENTDSDSDDDISLANLARANGADQAITTTTSQHNYRWRKRDTIAHDYSFTQDFSEPPVEEMTPLQYFSLFFTTDILEIVVQQTNIYSFQKCHKVINTNREEIMSLIGINLKMGITKLPSYKSYWGRELRFPAVADVMPRNRYQELSRYLHFVNNESINGEDKLAKIRPLILALRNQFVKVEPEEYHSVDEQIIPSKTKYSSIRQYNPKKPKKWGFKNLVRAGSSGFMYDFFVYDGKSSTENPSDTKYSHLQKCSQVVARLCEDLSRNKNYKVFLTTGLQH